MGERGADNELATERDIEKMAQIAKEAVEAGALGFSTSRTMVHATPEGVPIPGTFASTEELVGIGSAIAQTGKGVMEVVNDAMAGKNLEGELELMRQVAVTGCPVTF